MDHSYVWVHGHMLLLHPLLFSIMNALPQENLRFRLPPLKNYTPTEASDGYHQGSEIFYMNELPGASPRPKQYHPRTGRLITKDRPYEHMSVWTSPMYGYTDICSCYTHFSSQSWMPCHRRTCALDYPPWRIIPLRKPPTGTTRALKFFIWMNCLGRPLDRNSTILELGGL